MNIELVLREAVPENWVRCNNCTHRGDCEACGLDEGCYFGELDPTAPSEDDEDYLHWFD